jgi:hypothetical protein
VRGAESAADRIDAILAYLRQLQSQCSRAG